MYLNTSECSEMLGPVVGSGLFISSVTVSHRHSLVISIVQVINGSNTSIVAENLSLKFSSTFRKITFGAVTYLVVNIVIRERKTSGQQGQIAKSCRTELKSKMLDFP